MDMSSLLANKFDLMLRCVCCVFVQCILAAIVLVNLKGILMQITDIPLLYKNGQYYDLVSLLCLYT